MEKSPHFKPDQCALLLIDHQVGTIQLIKNITADQSIRNAVTLAKAALAFNMPIVMTSSQENHVQGPPHPSLEHTAPEAYANRVQRQGVVNAWDDPNFSKAVADTGRKQLIIAAVTTDICLVFPTISAMEAGYEVQAVLDASGSSYAIGEETSRRRMELRQQIHNHRRCSAPPLDRRQSRRSAGDPLARVPGHRLCLARDRSCARAGRICSADPRHAWLRRQRQAAWQ
ncbi:isochorismatase family protein [Paraburkholderia polaris]|uniref:isochorismatase family protein n=1 Tax=Paraburkholderia polaris TaxID=2728848 RepID=UPI0019802A54|nr:isochorismatase family protein [Paraburkholderia polaris]